MDLILLDSDMFLDRYDSKLCCRRLVRYVKDNPVDLIAVADFKKQKMDIWNKLKGFCSKVHYFLDPDHPQIDLDGVSIRLVSHGLKCDDQFIPAQQGAFAKIQVDPKVSWRYIVLDMLSDPEFEYYHHMRSLSEKHSAKVCIRIRNGHTKVLN